MSTSGAFAKARARSELERGRASRAGSTLLELLVALAVMAVSLAVAVVAFRAEPPPSSSELRAQVVARVRRTALDQRRAVTFVVDGDSGAVTGMAFPDGRVVVSDAGVVEPMSGRPDAR